MMFMHSDILDLIIALAAGLAIGSFYFLALWLTVRRLPRVRFPAVWTLGSYLVRSTVSMVGFYLVMAGCWERLLISLLGFIIMRTALVRWFQPPPKSSIIRNGDCVL